MCYCIDRKLVIVNSEIELQFIPPTTILAECTHDLNPSIQDSWGLIYNYNKIWVRAAVWVRKWIDGSDQVSESLLTTRDGAISRLGITWGVESGVISWTQRRLSNHCIKPPYSRTWAIKDHGNLWVSFTATPRILRLCQNQCYGVMCRVRCSLVYVARTGCLGGITHYLSLQRSWLQWTRQWWCTLTVPDITNECEPMKCFFN